MICPKESDCHNPACAGGCKWTVSTLDPIDTDFGRHVIETLAGTNRAMRDAGDAMRQTNMEIERLRAALRPFVQSYVDRADPIGDSDLYPEQPVTVFVTLGDCRRANAALGYLTKEGK